MVEEVAVEVEVAAVASVEGVVALAQRACGSRSLSARMPGGVVTSKDMV